MAGRRGFLHDTLDQGADAALRRRFAGSRGAASPAPGAPPPRITNTYPPRTGPKPAGGPEGRPAPGGSLLTVLDAEETRRLERWIRIFGVLSLVLVPLGVLLAAFYAPLLPDCDTTAVGNCQTSPLGQKIFYFHVPAAFAAYLALSLLAIGSYRFLSREHEVWDAFSVGAAEVGVLFAGMTLYTGSLWGHLEWGADTFGYWSNDDTKLVLTLILFLVYVGYLVLRRQIDDTRRRARIAAVYALFGFATVPLSYVAQRVWRSIHPTVFDPGNPQAGIVTPGVETTFVVNMAALLVLAAFLMLVRLRMELGRRDRADHGGEVA